MADSRDVDLLDDGVLWLINRCLFHRVGRSLAVAGDSRDLLLLGDGSEEWRFETSSMVDERERAVRSLIGDEAVDRLLTAAGPESESPL